jgi:hypothetical protein
MRFAAGHAVTMDDGHVKLIKSVRHLGQEAITFDNHH